MIRSVLLVTSLTQLSVTAPDPSNAGRGTTVLEAVFRDMVRDVPGLSGPYGDLVFCLEGPGKSDPPEPVLNRLAASGERVRPASACRIEKDGLREWVVERETGARAVILMVQSIQCPDELHCSVSCGYFSQGLSASGNTFEVEKRGGAWMVVRRQMHWIS